MLKCPTVGFAWKSTGKKHSRKLNGKNSNCTGIQATAFFLRRINKCDDGHCLNKSPPRKKCYSKCVWVEEKVSTWIIKVSSNCYDQSKKSDRMGDRRFCMCVLVFRLYLFFFSLSPLWMRLRWSIFHQLITHARCTWTIGLWHATYMP